MSGSLSSNASTNGPLRSSPAAPEGAFEHSVSPTIADEAVRAPFPRLRAGINAVVQASDNVLERSPALYPPRHIGSKTYELRDLEVFEFSFVAVGANRTTSVVAVKAPAGGTARLTRARAKLAQLRL